MRVIEHGPSVGHHKGRSIPGYIIDSRGVRYEFDRVAVLDKDGGFNLDNLGRSETIIAPGLIYRSGKQGAADAGVLQQ